MHRTTSILSVWMLMWALRCPAQPAEPLLNELPPGVFVENSMQVSPEQTKAIGQKLGGQIERLTNSMVNVHGAPIQVNVIDAADEASATAIHAALSKPAPYSLRKGEVVIEYVVDNADLAIKTSYELGLVDKPQRMRYRVVAELATIDKADYMSCNPLFNHFVALSQGNDAVKQIEELVGQFEFGQSLRLRNPRLGSEPAVYQFEPVSVSDQQSGATVCYSFEQLPNRHGVPYVTATMEIAVDERGLLPSLAEPAAELTAATTFWPAEDEEVVALAERITRGKKSHGAKAMAILQWLQPNRNVKYSGQTGSRWGTQKVLAQKFGHCWDFSDCFVTLCRAAGVPARQVAGWLYGSSGHVWAEFYRAGKGWQQVDPTGGGLMLCGIYHIPYFTSEDGHMPVLYLSMPKIEATPAT